MNYTALSDPYIHLEIGKSRAHLYFIQPLEHLYLKLKVRNHDTQYLSVCTSDLYLNQK
jgi:hypothetical protein